MPRRPVLICAVSIVAGAAAWWLSGRLWAEPLPQQIRAAERLMTLHRFDAAASQMERVLRAHPDQPEALSILGRCRLESQQTADAVEFLARVPVDSPAFATAGFPLGSAWLQLGYLERAEATLTEYVARFPGDDAAREELRWLYFNQFRPREAISLLQEKLRRTSADPETLAALIDSEYRQQVPFEGANYLQQINERQPGQATVELALGYADWRIGKVDEARPLLQQAITALPDMPHARFVVGGFLIEQGQPTDAEQILTRAPTPENDDRYWSLLSQIVESRDQFPLALQHLDKALKLRPKEQRYLSHRAGLLRKLGRAKDATAVAADAFELQKVDRELADIVEARTHHEPTHEAALRIAGLYERLGRALESTEWRKLAERLPQGRPSP